jgi:hypothetical protein
MVQQFSAKLKFIESIFGKGKLARNGKNFDVWCPICASSDKTKRKLSICVENDRNHCWVCGHGAKSLMILIRRFGTHEQFITYRDKYAPRDARIEKFVLEELEQKVELPRDFQLLVTATSIDPDVKFMRNYLAKRGMDEHDLWYYKFGFSQERRWNRRVIMPSFDAHGVLNYFIARAIDSERKPKYDNPDCKKTEIIFNEINIDWTQRLTLCEGPFDYVKCGENSTPLLGSDLDEDSALFNAITVHNTPVAIALDTDMRSSKMITLAKKFTLYGNDVVMVDLGGVDDPGKMTRVQMRNAIASAEPHTWVNDFNTRLAAASKMTLRV